MSTDMERKKFIDLARGITILCVVFFHAAKRIDPSVYYYNYFVIPSDLLNSVIMPFFLMVSGAFLRNRLLRNDFSNVAFLKKITSSILKPFYTLSFLFFIMNIAAPKSMGRPSASEMIKALVTLNFSGDSMPSSILWFLFVLFVFALITFGYVKILKGNIYILFMFSIILKWSNHYWHDQIYYFALNIIGQFYIFYVAGYLLSGYIQRADLFSNNKINMSFLICWLTAFYVTIIEPVEYINRLIYSLGIDGISGGLFILGICYKVSNRFSFNPVSAFLCYCGEHSILIYSFHTASFLIFQVIVYNTDYSYDFFGFIVKILFGIFLPLIIGKLLSKNNFAHKLLLGRSP